MTLVLQTIEERIDRVVGAVPFGIYVVERDSGLTRNDLANLRPGRILVVNDVEKIRFIPSVECLTLGCIAGWISDEDAA